MKHYRAFPGRAILGVLACLLLPGCATAIAFHSEFVPSTAADTRSDTRAAKKPAPLPKAGDVLIAGGTSAGLKSTSAAEFFDPTTNKFLLTKPMSTARAGAMGAALAGADTRVLVAGGATESVKFKKHVGIVTASVLNTAQVYDPATGAFTSTSGAMNANRVAGTATQFTSGPMAGKVLIAGGIDQNGNILKSAEIFDPASGTFAPTANNMTDPRAFHTATLLNDGTVLVAGGAMGNDGSISNTSDIFDPSTGQFSPTAGSMSTERAAASATLLGDGTVLLAGGAANFGQIGAIAGAEIYNPATKTFTSLGAAGALKVPRALHSATLLPDGTVLIAGGQSGAYSMPAPNEFTFAQGKALDSAEIFDPLQQTFTCLGGSACPKVMVNARMAHGATMLGNNKVLLSGGLGGVKATQSQKALNSAELFDPSAKSFKKVGPMKKPHAFHVAALLANVP